MNLMAHWRWAKHDCCRRCCQVNSPDAKLVTLGPQRHWIGGWRCFKVRLAWNARTRLLFHHVSLSKKFFYENQAKWRPKMLTFSWFSLFHLISKETMLGCSCLKGVTYMWSALTGPNQKKMFCSWFNYHFFKYLWYPLSSEVIPGAPLQHRAHFVDTSV